MSDKMNSPFALASPDSYIYSFDDPQRYGPGMWLSFFINSIRCRNKTELLLVCKQVRDFCTAFGCSGCRGHCKAYLEENPIENSATTAKALFYYLVTFCNGVYIRLGKPIMDVELMYRKFKNLNKPICSGACDESEELPNYHSTIQPVTNRGFRAEVETTVPKYSNRNYNISYGSYNPVRSATRTERRVVYSNNNYQYPKLRKMRSTFSNEDSDW